MSRAGAMLFSGRKRKRTTKNSRSTCVNIRSRLISPHPSPCQLQIKEFRIGFLLRGCNASKPVDAVATSKCGICR
eukprot:7622895-Pyramimonas_sp.AAC.1